MAQPPGPSDDQNDPARPPSSPPSTPHGTAYPGPGAYLGPNAGQAPPPPQHPQQGYANPQQGYANPQQGYGHPQQQGYPGYPQQQGYPPGYGYAPRVPMTPDGAVLSGWWRRVGARVVDGLIITVASLPLTGYFIYRYIELYWDAAMAEAETGTERAELANELAEVRSAVRAEKLGQVAAEFDRVHSIQRAVAVGSVDAVIRAEELRPQLIAALESRLS